MWRSLDQPKIRPELRQLANVVQPEATEVLEFLISLPPTQSSGSQRLGLRLHQAEEVDALLVEEVHDGGRCAEKNKRMANKLRKVADPLSPGDWICIVNNHAERSKMFEAFKDGGRLMMVCVRFRVGPGTNGTATTPGPEATPPDAGPNLPGVPGNVPGVVPASPQRTMLRISVRHWDDRELRVELPQDATLEQLREQLDEVMGDEDRSAYFFTFNGVTLVDPQQQLQAQGIKDLAKVNIVKEDPPFTEYRWVVVDYDAQEEMQGYLPLKQGQVVRISPDTEAPIDPSTKWSCTYVFGYPLDGPKDDDHGGWMPTEALAAQKKPHTS